MTRYRCIAADPPWNERGGGKSTRGAQRHYPLRKTADIPRVMMASPLWKPETSCHLWLWTTNNFLGDALWVMQKLGFIYKTNLVWHKMRNGKTQIGLGQYLRGSHELCLFGTRGRIPYAIRADGKRVARPSVVIAERTKHSRKPVEAFDVIEAVSPGPRLEMFARDLRDGWDVHGNEL